MEVEIRPAMNGCLSAMMAVMTLGLTLILTRLLERNFIRRMNETGFETRGGMRIAWSDIVHVRRVTGRVKGVQLSDELVIDTTKGRVSFPYWRIVNADEAFAYFTRHARSPESLGRR